MNNFVEQSKWARMFGRNLCYCNRARKYFWSGKVVPGRCCDIIYKRREVPNRRLSCVDNHIEQLENT